MSDSTFVSLSGVVQSFGDNPVVNERETSAGIIREFTIRTTGNQKLVRVSVFPEYADSIDGLAAGDGVFVDGSYSERVVGEKTYNNLTSKTVARVPVAPRAASSRPARAAKASF